MWDHHCSCARISRPSLSLAGTVHPPPLFPPRQNALWFDLRRPLWRRWPIQQGKAALLLHASPETLDNPAAGKFTSISSWPSARAAFLAAWAWENLHLKRWTIPLQEILSLSALGRRQGQPLWLPGLGRWHLRSHWGTPPSANTSAGKGGCPSAVIIAFEDFCSRGSIRGLCLVCVGAVRLYNAATLQQAPRVFIEAYHGPLEGWRW